MHAQRANEGRIAIALILDPSNPQLTPMEVPGVMHLPLLKRPPFRLLHAKLALLGFRHLSDARRWRLRLIVSTGNWTRQTLEDSLDLAWRVDLGDQDFEPEGPLAAQIGSDIGAAWETLDWLRGHFDVRVLSAHVPGRPDPISDSHLVEEWIARARKIGTGITPRFFDNRGRSLLAQLPDLVRTHASQSARNHLCMGSGYYESPNGESEIPSVLGKIVDALQRARLITLRPRVDVFVNPDACQAVAGSVAAIMQAGWNLREAGQPECFRARRLLHAKFIFSATYRDDSEFCNSAWLYLGSGNLSNPGFVNPMASHSGNLEAGVLVVPKSLRWRSAKGVAPERVVTNLLPLQWDTDFSQQPESLAPGSEMPNREMQYFAAPVAYFFWMVEEGGNWLRTPEVLEQFDLLDDIAGVCNGDAAKGYRWQGSRPRQVQVRWFSGAQERRAWVPVIDEFGRIAATILPRIDIDEAWNQLANFPMPPDEVELLADAERAAADTPTCSGIGDGRTASYPVRRMMQLIENIASKQASVGVIDWKAWCTRLEQCLVQAAGSSVLEEFRKMEINPLSPLWHPAFRPNFATSRETAEGLRYERVLQRVEAAWEVARFARLGNEI